MSSDADLIRVFAAVDVDPSSALNRVVNRVAALGRNIRPVSVGQLHVTLKFFGDIDEATVPLLTQRLNGIANRAATFEARVCRVGAFPSRRRPLVLWAGVEDDGQMAMLADEIDALGEEIGIRREARRFHPHVTLARVRGRPPHELETLFEEFADEDFGTQSVRKITLYRSVLQRQGSVYERLHVAQLRQS